ncbi:rhodanese-like domain-containing protein [Wenjunlia tyrosinilytica]|uniref:Sulfurtransferase n=1 Tax=Wenjunlia tyrosinilytica TaxID=1544741 RepID=A0A917ZPD1_9ACTN|nr:sulfurtransferase [Wenjunlia tyrosinilytica]
MSETVDSLVDRARARIGRLTPEQARGAVEAGAVLVDTRYQALRERDGLIPGAVIVERNELEWRFDPACPYKLPQAVDHDVHVIVVCNEGYASSLAAASLRDLGLRRADDLDGGFQAWAAAGLPVVPAAGAGGGEGGKGAALRH